MRKLIAGVFLIIAVLTLSPSYSDESFIDKIIPTNRNSSVQYLLYTPENPDQPCYIEPKASMFDNCSFNSSYETKFVIHGYQVKLSPGNLFEKIKDTLLEEDKYNVIIVNWTKYDQQNYILDLVYAYIVGVDVASMINFLTAHANVTADSVHLIGHSLGAQIAGIAGKHVDNLGRITGLDPAGPGYLKAIRFDRLTSSDANLVDVIHTSDTSSGDGFGTQYPMGSINFYPNGGQENPMCEIGKNYSDGDGKIKEVQTSLDQADCNHDSSITYFISSILDCEYLSTQCKNYESYNSGQCQDNSNVTNRMGFHCVSIPGLQDNSKFYLNTTGTLPFC